MKNPIVLFLAFCLAFLAFCGCVGAPSSVDELDSMPQAEFEDWKLRTSALAEEAAFATVQSDPSKLSNVEGIAAALTLICRGEIKADAVRDLGLDPACAGLLRVAVLELSAVLRERIGEASHPRMAEMVCAFADALETGALRALGEPTEGR